MKSSHIVLSLCSKRTIGERQKHLSSRYFTLNSQDLLGTGGLVAKLGQRNESSPRLSRGTNGRFDWQWVSLLRGSYGPPNNMNCNV